MVRPPSLEEHVTGRSIVTGGLGSLGSAMTAWLVQHGVRHVHILGRSAHQIPAELVNSAASVTVAMGNVGMGSDVSLPPGPTTGCLLHTAGVLRDGMLTQQSAARLRAAWAPKALGARTLTNALQHEPCTHHVLFSSVAGALGSPGQLNYAAANASLDTMAIDQQQRGLATCSVQWGAFGDVGMALRDASTLTRVTRMGMVPLSVQQGLGMLRWTLFKRHMPAVVGAHPMDWHRYLQHNPAAAPLTAEQGVQEMMASSLSKQRVMDIERMVEAAVMDAVGHAVAADAPLMSAGLDSLAAVEFRNALSRQLGVDLPSTLIFDHPTVKSIVALVRTLTGWAAAPLVAPPAHVATVAPSPIAIVAHTHRAPVIPSKSMLHGADGVGPVTRWDSDAVAHRFGNRPARFASLLKHVEDFDAPAFLLSPAEAALLDPQQRLLLECGAEVLQGASIDKDNAGVFVGVAGTDYARLVLKYATAPGGYAATAGAASVVSGRLSYTFGLQVIPQRCCRHVAPSIHPGSVHVGGHCVFVNPHGCVVGADGAAHRRLQRCAVWSHQPPPRARHVGAVCPRRHALRRRPVQGASEKKGTAFMIPYRRPWTQARMATGAQRLRACSSWLPCAATSRHLPSSARSQPIRTAGRAP